MMVKRHEVFENTLKVVYDRGFVELQHLFGPEARRHYTFTFSTSEFTVFVQWLEKVGAHVWGRIVPKEANSVGSDYWEYYSRKYDNNGHLTINAEGSMITLHIEAPVLYAEELYRFNKSKFQSFMYDAQRCVEVVNAHVRTM